MALMTVFSPSRPPPPLPITPISISRFSITTSIPVSRKSKHSTPLGFPSRPLHFCPNSNALKCFCSSEKQPSEEFERLFSNLNQVTLKREPGSVTSGIFLVAGTTVGAGILAIPAVTQEAGFLASAVTCILCWLYMVVTGLLIAEVNVNTMCELGSSGVSLVSMAKRTLGKVGVQVACWSYIFIHYALLVAYVARSSDILTNFLNVPLWESATLFSLVFGGICYFGSQQFIGLTNGILIFGIIASFAALVGVAVPLVLFLIWDAVILGAIPYLETSGDKIADPLEQLRSNNDTVGPIVEVFSLLAIATSYIGFVLGLSDFLSDLLKLPTGQSKPLPYLLTLVPPLVLSLLDPEIFFKALDFAGTYGVLVLFGILPAAMSWSERYSDALDPPKLPQLVPGGKFTLCLVIGGASVVILTEIFENFTRL